MKVPSSNEKPKNLLDLVSSNDAVKVNTKSSASSAENSNSRPATETTVNEGKATAVKLGLAKYILEEFEPKKLSESRAQKIADIKARIDDGTYLSSINSEQLVEKILEESKIENLIASKIAGNE